LGLGGIKINAQGNQGENGSERSNLIHVISRKIWGSVSVQFQSITHPHRVRFGCPQFSRVAANGSREISASTSHAQTDFSSPCRIGFAFPPPE
jgi:hypothetical protein